MAAAPGLLRKNKEEVMPAALHPPGPGTDRGS